MKRLVAKIRRSLERDRELPLATRLAKGGQFLASTALAPLYLRACTRVGARARVIGGKPRIENHGRLEIGDDFTISSTFCRLEMVTAPGGAIEIGNRVVVNFGTVIHARQLVRIADGVNIGPYAIIADSEFLVDGAAGNDGDVVAPIEIGERVWLASRVTVLPGSRIGAGSIISAGSIVSGVIPPGVVVARIPARVVRRLGPDVKSEQERAEGAAAASTPAIGAETR